MKSKDGEIIGEIVLDCFQKCSETLSKCLQRGGKHASAEHINILLDCINICQITASAFARKSEYAGVIAQTCAEICEGCALECGRFSEKFMKECAKICQACAKSCQKGENMHRHKWIV